MRIRLAAVVLAALLATSLFAIDFKKATPEELAMKSVDFAPGAPAVVLDWIQRTDDTNGDTSKYVRIKILSDAGKKYADVEIPYAPQIAGISGVDARMTRPDGTIVPFGGKVYDKVLIKTSGLRLMAKTFTFPDVQPGSILEYRYYLGSGDRRYLYDSVFVLQRELPVLHASLWLKPYEKDFSSFFVHRGLPPGKQPVRMRDHYELELEKIPAFEEEAFAPPEGEMKMRVNFFYSEAMRIPDAASFWAGQGKSLTSKVEKFIGDSGAVRSAATAAIGGATTSEAKLHALYLRAQQIRNLDYEEIKSEAEQKKLRENKSAEDVIANNYGTSAEISRTFAALARAAGFDASQVRIGERDEAYFAQAVPIASQLDGEVTVVVVDGKQRWFDAGTPGAPFGVLAWQKSEVPGLLLSRKATADWVKTPEQAPAEAKLVRKAALRFEDGAVRGRVTATYTGHEALLRRIQNHNDDDAAVKKSFEETARTWFPDGAIKNLSVTGLKSVDDPIVVTFDVDLPSLGSSAASRAILPMSVFAASAKNPFAAAQRKNPIVFSHAWSEEDDVTLDMPEGYAVESLPQGVSWDVGAATYKTAYATDGKSVHLKRALQVYARFFDVTAYEPIRKFFGRVTAADQEQLVLKSAAKAAGK
jgi:hypothetical protein